MLMLFVCSFVCSSVTCDVFCCWRRGLIVSSIQTCELKGVFMATQLDFELSCVTIDTLPTQLDVELSCVAIDGCL